MGELACTFNEFQLRGKQLIDAAPDLDDEGLDNAIKMFNLSYLNATYTNDREEYQGPIILKLVLRKVEELRPGSVYRF